MKQVVILHGGYTFSSYDAYIDSLKSIEIDYERLKLQKKWKPWIAEQLTDYDVLLPMFPNGSNAVYEEWKIYFEKLISFFGDDVQLVGHSLGAMFLAKYLQEKPLAKKIKRLILVAPCYNDDSTEDLGSFEVLSSTKLPESAEEIHLFFSKDDPVIPFTELAKFQRDMPSAITHTFENYGHFNTPTFPELLELLQSS
jgi:predicted alpha/beta hydrolase family esterase